MVHTYYNRKTLQQLDDYALSFGVSINLLDSAFNILQHPTDLLKNKTGSYYLNKSIAEYELIACFQSVTTALELLLKSVISLKSWKFLFANPKKVNRATLINGEFRSLNFDNFLNTIEDKCKILISQRLKNRIETLREIRNKIAHYYLDFTKEDLLTYIAFGLDIFIEIYRTHLKDEVFDEKDRTDKFEEELADINQFVEARIESAKSNNTKFHQLKPGLYNQCPKCSTTNLVVNDLSEIKCLYCGNLIDIEEYAEILCIFEEDPKVCSKCEKQTVVKVISDEPVCIFCEFIAQLIAQ